ncbi:hypothetical protein PoB_004207000 [Plakobranchus ocellatus]|uniref:Uncharacterized protein n=1 Tax=Plakobranchus ocellatus TaxID=259542 RepID=A0AAV4B4P7_9GAST|nr:hypothetical protein PoB_004207000 [Plakobranchus ocellatus]
MVASHTVAQHPTDCATCPPPVVASVLTTTVLSLLPPRSHRSPPTRVPLVIGKGNASRRLHFARGTNQGARNIGRLQLLLRPCPARVDRIKKGKGLLSPDQIGTSQPHGVI